MFVLGFQEIVPLTAQQIVQTDPEKRYVPKKKYIQLKVNPESQASLGRENP
jgi:hypothetical protein